MDAHEGHVHDTVCRARGFHWWCGEWGFSNRLVELCTRMACVDGLLKWGSQVWTVTASHTSHRVLLCGVYRSHEGSNGEAKKRRSMLPLACCWLVSQLHLDPRAWCAQLPRGTVQQRQYLGTLSETNEESTILPLVSPLRHQRQQHLQDGTGRICRQTQ